MKLPRGIQLDDPRPIAASAPYTYSLPNPDELQALGPGDAIKAIFRETNGGKEYDAERMWVRIDKIQGQTVIGRVDNIPFDMPSIQLHDLVEIPLTHAIDVDYAEGKPHPVVPERRWYWDRCLVDACILSGRSPVDYLYREEPDTMQPDDTYPDSGWRIRGTDAGIVEDERLGEEPEYIALGKVLNQDDRWLHLIDSEVGCAFQWDSEHNDFVEAD